MIFSYFCLTQKLFGLRIVANKWVEAYDTTFAILMNVFANCKIKMCPKNQNNIQIFRKPLIYRVQNNKRKLLYIILNENIICINSNTFIVIGLWKSVIKQWNMHIHFHLTLETIKSCNNLQKKHWYKKSKGLFRWKTFIYK